MSVRPLNPPQFDVDDNDGVRAYKLKALVDDLIRSQGEIIEELNSIIQNGGGGSGGASALGDLTDVTLGTLADQQSLIYDLATTMWVNQDDLSYPAHLGYAGL